MRGVACGIEAFLFVRSKQSLPKRSRIFAGAMTKNRLHAGTLKGAAGAPESADRASLWVPFGNPIRGSDWGISGSIPGPILGPFCGTETRPQMEAFVLD